jgi:hypothetical protein
VTSQSAVKLTPCCGDIKETISKKEKRKKKKEKRNESRLESSPYKVEQWLDLSL